MDVQVLVSALHGEHPQTIALVLAHLPPDQAAQALALLSKDLQGDVAFRMATAKDANPAVVRTVFADLLRRVPALRDPARPLGPASGGASYLAEVLKHTEGATQQRLLDALNDRSPDLAAELLKNRISFDDLAKLPDRHMQRLWRELRTDDVLLALRGAPDAVRDVFFRNMSKRARTAFEDEFARRGPQPKSKVDEARQTILAAASRLADQEEITFDQADDPLV